MTKLKVHIMLFIEATYECTADVPTEYLGREVEFLEQQGFPKPMTLRTNPGVVGLSGQMPTWNTADADLRVIMAEVVE